MLKKDLLIELWKMTRNRRTAWGRGVALYAVELVESIETEEITSISEKMLLNGAQGWAQYSEGGCTLIYDGDIAERLCTPSELKRTKGGEFAPNKQEEWLDVQARALYQAYILIKRELERPINEERMG